MSAPPIIRALQRQPKDINLSQAGLKYHFLARNLPNIDFWAQKIIVPGGDLPSVTQPTPFNNLTYPGSKIQYGKLQVQFNLDQGLKTYLELMAWTAGCAKPYGFKAAQLLAASDPLNILGREYDGTKTDIYAIICDSHDNPLMRFIFQEAYPVSWSELTLDSQQETPGYLPFSVGFDFDVMTIGLDV